MVKFLGGEVDYNDIKRKRWCPIAREKPQYEEVAEFNDMVRKLIELNADEFAHIDPNVLRMVAITNKEPNGSMYKIIPVKNPVGLFCKDVRFIIRVYQQDWEAYSEDTKALVIINALLALEPDEDEPKIIPYDLSDHAKMIRTFGVDYLNNPEIKGLLTKPVKW